MHVAIVGSRDLPDCFFEALCAHVPIGASEIRSGGAQGADAFAARYAHENGLRLTLIEPDYARYGRRAPLERSERIIEGADYVIALWDGRSRGTAYTIKACLERNIPVRVLLCREEDTSFNSTDALILL